MFFKTHIFCCTNRRPEGHKRGCCASKGAEKIRDYMKARVKELGVPDTRVNMAGCLDRCEAGPCIVLYPEGIWYSCKTIEDAEEIIQSHVLHGKDVRRLRIDKE